MPNGTAVMVASEYQQSSGAKSTSAVRSTSSSSVRLERTLTYSFDPTNKNVSSVTDRFLVSDVHHSRQTTYTFDDVGNISRMSYLANTASPTWRYSYDPGYGGITKITDPLGHECRFTYAYPDGCMTRAEDDLPVPG